MDKIKFSIIVPVFNRERQIAETLNSVLAQDSDTYELLIVDDGSTDQSAKVIEEIVAKHKSKNVRYFYKENAERAAARNYGVQQAKGEFVSFLDSDDIFLENWLDQALDFSHRHPKAEWFHLAYDFRNSEGKFLRPADKLPKPANQVLIEGNPLSCLGVFLKREIALQHPFDENRALSGLEDWELWLRLAAKYPLLHSERVFASLILHDERSVLQKDADALIKKVTLFKDKVLGRPEVLNFIGKQKNRFLSSTHSYLALHLALMKGQRKNAVKYLSLSLREYPASIFRKRFYATLWRLV